MLCRTSFSPLGLYEIYIVVKQISTYAQLHNDITVHNSYAHIACKQLPVLL